MHIYNDNTTGKDVYSVTTILDAIKGNDIAEYANFLGFKRIKFKDEMERYAIRGTFIHKVLEAYLDRTKVDLLPQKLSYFDQQLKINIERKMQTLISRFKKFELISSEKELVSSKLGYGGTIDLIANINNNTVLVDYKSASRVRTDMLLQLAGYYNLCKEFDIHIDFAMILLINENTLTHFPVSKDTLEQMGDIFNQLAKYYNMRLECPILNKLKADKVDL